MLRSSRPALAAILSILAAACADVPLTSPPPSSPEAPAGRTFGLVEVTISGLGTGEVTSSALAAPSVEELEQLRATRETERGGPGKPSLSLTPPDNAGGGANGTIQLDLLSTGSFTDGAPGSGGMRYLYATYRVRNAQRDGTAYDTPRKNLTFLAVDTDGTIGHTAVSSLNRFNGTAANPSLAEQLIPTGALVKHPAREEIESSSPDVLQLFTETEAADVLGRAPAGVRDVFPYGFVVRREGVNDTRELPASPWPVHYNGIVTFAFKVPLQASPADDPFTISLTFLAVDDSETRITQSLEEQSQAGNEAFAERAAGLGVSGVTLLPGARYSGSGMPRVLCSVRTAGPAAAPSATLFANPGTAPWIVTEKRARLSANTSFAAARCGTAWNAPDASNFVVHGSQSGRVGVGQAFALDEGAVRSPATSFFPGEEVEVVVTTALGVSAPIVTRYRIGSAPAHAIFSTVNRISMPNQTHAHALGDLNGDGALDIVAADFWSNSVSVLLGNGSGGFGPATNYATGGEPYSVALGDVDGDGVLDIITVNSWANNVSVLRGDASGGFGPPTNYATGDTPESAALGDLNGDGLLDIVTANSSSNTMSVLLGTGGGGFAPATNHATGVSTFTIALGDVDGDGILDIVTANYWSNSVSVLRGDGSGGFARTWNFSAGQNPASLALGDLNGDGMLDIVTANMTANTVSVLLGHPGGLFGPVTKYATGEYPFFVTLGDLDGDGTLDIVTANESSNNVSVRLSNGRGGFIPATSYATGVIKASVALGDMDGDGTLDIVTANGSNQSLTILRNARK